MGKKVVDMMTCRLEMYYFQMYHYQMYIGVHLYIIETLYLGL